MNGTAPLIVYKASAGSGKTYTLTREYIGLLMRGWYEEHISKHDRILAATFTNKATIELRERIIRELINIRDGNADNLGLIILNSWRRDGEITETDYNKKIKDLPRVAGSLLQHILEDYGAFRVQTIDSFFQEVVRGFALEISSLAGTYNVELQEKDLIALSLDQLFIRLGEEDKSDILRILSNIYAMDAESGEEKVNIRKQLITLTGKFLDNKYADVPLSADDYTEEKIRAVRSKLSDVIREIEASVGEKTAGFVGSLDVIVANYALNLEESSSSMLHNIYIKLSDYKEFIREYVEKGNSLLSSTLRRTLNNPDSLFYAKSKYKNNSPTALSYAKADRDLRNTLEEISKYEDVLSETIRPRYLTATLILKYVDLMPALFEAKKAVEEYQREQNVVLISRINVLLRDIINGSDVPFIYDKVGTTIEHFMIDEFQDTSRLQWDNFLPLLLESLGHGRLNYLVGDVKQSIYRFRGTDSSLLSEDVTQMPQAQVKALDTNWRSYHEVVEFNNLFFQGVYSTISYLETGIPRISEHFSAYEQDVIQLSHHREGGYVELNFTTKEGNSKSYLEVSIRPEVLKLILALQDEYHFHRRDIALLVRSNSDANMVANWLTEKSAEDPLNAIKYSFISDEALSISTSRTVLLLAQYISFVANNRTEQKQIELRLYLQIFLNLCDRDDQTDELLLDLIKLSEQGLGLYESVAQILNILPCIPPTEMVYVNSFMDYLFSFSSKNTATFQLFEEWWLRQKDQLRVEMGGIAQDSITIITIHKAKGLEFPVVIMPNADWAISNVTGRDINLFDNTQEVEDNFHITLPSYYLDAAPSRRNRSTYFCQQYLMGMEADFMDNLNLLYVAFTRAVQHLYVYSAVSRKHEPPTNRIGDLILLRILELSGGTKQDQYTFGTRTCSTVKDKPYAHTHELRHLTANPRYDHLQFATEKYMSGEMREGSILHRILEGTHRVSDFEKAVQQAVQSGLISTQLAEQITTDFTTVIHTNSTVATWFTPSDDRIILSETSISESPELHLHRPDRIILTPSTNTITVVDYKFGKHRSKYKTQIQSYIQALRSMGYQTQGYLWYNLSADPADLVLI